VSRKTWKSPYLAMCSWRAPKPDTILKKIVYCSPDLLLAIAKFGSFHLWMVAILTTSQHWMKKTPTVALPWKAIFFLPNYKLNNHYYTFRLFI
jgi:hypothetical protein